MKNILSRNANAIVRKKVKLTQKTKKSHQKNQIKSKSFLVDGGTIMFINTEKAL